MTHAVRVVAVAAVLTVLVLCLLVQAQMPDFSPEFIESMQARAEEGNAGSQNIPGLMCQSGYGVPQDAAEAVHWWRLAAAKTEIQAKTTGPTVHRGMRILLRGLAIGLHHRFDPSPDGLFEWR